MTEFLDGSVYVFKFMVSFKYSPIQAIHTYAYYQTFCFDQYQLYVHRDQINGAA